jgi:hypothetical protein
MIWTCFKNEQRIPKVLNKKSKWKMHEGDRGQDGNKIGKMSCRRKEEYGKSSGETDGKTWFSGNPHKVEMS